jgi:CRP-like cAMP-binding protein
MNFEYFINHLQAYGTLPSNLKNELRHRCEYFNVGEKTVIVEPGQPSKYLYFVGEGLLRTYRFNEGLEETLNFTGANEMIGFGEGFLDRNFSENGVMCHIKCLGVKIRHLDWQLLSDENPIFMELSLRLLQQQLIKMENDSLVYRKKDTKEKMHQLAKLHPGIMENVARKHIGSYFGITEQAVSNLLCLIKKCS